ncbi:helix-turn-helix domain-containing protein [Dysosmobacter welbionis]|uniref:helix-turn-helix domain-containing protein n=1 Tax=Dysosmobacter welbionis TaxID=2093857 RepID=UPI0029435375|nr:helix-turn-helix domain-containing protein [Dysosmobacter welbionis]MBS6882816.1 helix-turn-helix domain-containing protein [Clostridiaceae bacterium]
MKVSDIRSYSDLPLFLNAHLVAQVLGVSISTAYEVMHEPSFPTLRVGSRMVVPKEKFIQWAEEQSGGAK